MSASRINTQGTGPDPRHVRPRVLIIPGAIMLVLGLAIGVLLKVHGGGAPLGVDVTWVEWMARLREAMPWLVDVAEVFNVVGGGWFGVVVLPLLVVVAFLLARQSRRAVIFLIASVASALVVQALKWLFDRERPAGMLVTSDAGSFPSGHVANAATLAVLACALVLRRWWVVVFATVYVLAMALSRSILDVHWLTDLAGGALVGGGVGLVVLGLTVTTARAASDDGATPG